MIKLVIFILYDLNKPAVYVILIDIAFAVYVICKFVYLTVCGIFVFVCFVAVSTYSIPYFSE